MKGVRIQRLIELRQEYEEAFTDAQRVAINNERIKIIENYLGVVKFYY